MSSISALLKDLSATLGAEVVRTEAMKFFSQQGQEAQEGQEGQDAQGGKEKKPKKEKKEVKPRGPSEWNLYCRQVLEEMKKENPSATPKMAMVAAKESWAQKKASQVVMEAEPTVAEKIALLKEKRASLETQIKAVEAEPSVRSDTNVWVEEKKARTKKASQASGGGGGGAEAAQEPLDPVEDERRKVFKYLFTLQASGSTNMMGAGPYLQGQFSFSSGQAEAYVLEYISSYQALKAKYN